MSLYKAIMSAIAALFLLSACQTLSTVELRDQTQDELDRLALPEATSRLDQIFLRQLDENLAQDEALRDLALSTSLSVASSSTLSVKGKSSSLSKSTMTLTYDITDRVSKERLTSGTLTATATSGTVSSYYGQEQSKKFISERLARTLSDRLAQSLRLFFLNRETP